MGVSADHNQNHGLQKHFSEGCLHVYVCSFSKSFARNLLACSGDRYMAPAMFPRISLLGIRKPSLFMWVKRFIFLKWQVNRPVLVLLLDQIPTVASLFVALLTFVFDKGEFFCGTWVLSALFCLLLRAFLSTQCSELSVTLVPCPSNTCTLLIRHFKPITVPW